MIPRARLVTMEGDDYSIPELLGIEPCDAHLIKRNLSPSEKMYLNLRYPEYMGAIPAIIAKIVSVGASIGKGIASAVKKKREAKKQQSAQKQAEEQRKIAEYQYMMQIQAAQQAKKKKDDQLLLMAGIPILLGLIMLARS